MLYILMCFFFVFFLIADSSFYYFYCFDSSADTPFGQVKLGELGAWFGRRNKTPEAIWSGIHRGLSYVSAHSIILL